MPTRLVFLACKAVASLREVKKLSLIFFPFPNNSYASLSTTLSPTLSLGIASRLIHSQCQTFWLCLLPGRSLGWRIIHTVPSFPSGQDSKGGLRFAQEQQLVRQGLELTITMISELFYVTQSIVQQSSTRASGMKGISLFPWCGFRIKFMMRMMW